ncbi:MarR family transcriptional regulator, partial [Escherichia coli]|nr:MarR family transcriptional regulator [Escherichia coli]
MDEVRWLDDREERLWRGWLQLGALLPAELHRELQADAGLSYP